MINEAKHIKELTSLGLSENEAKTYLTLLAKSSMTVGEIAKISGVPRPKLYEILTKLIVKGLCTEKIGKVKRYRVVAPNIVKKKLIGDYQAQLEQKKIIAQNFSNAVNSIYKQNMNKTEPLEYIEVLNDKEKIRRKCSDFQKNAKKEILAFTKTPYTASLTKYVNEEVDALKRKVKIRSIYEYKDFTKEEFVKGISLWVSAGEKAKVVKELPIKMVIFDEKITMFALDDHISLKPSITTMIINHPSFAKTLKYVFESIWKEAMTLEEFKIKYKGSPPEVNLP